MQASQKAVLASHLERLAASRGDPQAWDALYVLLWPRVMAMTYHDLGGLRERAEDASQDVFIRLARYCDFQRLRDPDGFLRYLHTVCRNVVNDRLREWLHTVPQGEVALGQVPILTVDTPEEITRAKELLEKLREHMNDEEQRLTELLLGGHKLSEIAGRMRWSYSKAGVRVHRLRQKLRMLMKSKGL